ncbi:MAG TPA: cytochrome c [Gemmatimonadales bacterium]|nr:cytochrome c [Gemmatimonadales bacterium]
MRRSLVATALLLAGCNWWYDRVPSPDDLMKRFPWFDHMIKSRAIHPYARVDIPRSSVPGTVPITGAEPEWGGEFLSGKTTTADRIQNPTRPEETLAKGDTLFHFFCAVCHGPVGAGDGPVGVRLGAPSLLTDKARAFSDGYLYSITRYGRGLMPRYGDKIYHPADRWAVVNYVRKLQGVAPLSVAAGPAAGPPAVPPAGRPAAQPPGRR